MSDLAECYTINGQIVEKECSLDKHIDVYSYFDSGVDEYKFYFVNKDTNKVVKTLEIETDEGAYGLFIRDTKWTKGVDNE